MSQNSNERIVRQFIEEVWNRGASESIDSFLDAGFLDRAYKPGNAQGHRAMVEILKSTVANAAWSIERIVANDDTVICEMMLTGTHSGAFAGIQPIGNPISVRAYRSFALAGGKIVEHSALLDTHMLLMQMAKDTGDTP